MNIINKSKYCENIYKNFCSAGILVFKLEKYLTKILNDLSYNSNNYKKKSLIKEITIYRAKITSKIRSARKNLTPTPFLAFLKSNNITIEALKIKKIEKSSMAQTINSKNPHVYWLLKKRRCYAPFIQYSFPAKHPWMSVLL